MPQMHPLMWTTLFSFSLICLIFVISIMFFSMEKPNLVGTLNSKEETKNLTWKW